MESKIVEAPGGTEESEESPPTGLGTRLRATLQCIGAENEEWVTSMVESHDPHDVDDATYLVLHHFVKPHMRRVNQLISEGKSDVIVIEALKEFAPRSRVCDLIGQLPPGAREHMGLSAWLEHWFRELIRIKQCPAPDIPASHGEVVVGWGARKSARMGPEIRGLLWRRQA